MSIECLQVQRALVKVDVSHGKAARNACNISYGLHSPQVTFDFDERDNVYSL